MTVQKKKEKKKKKKNWRRYKKREEEGEKEEEKRKKGKKEVFTRQRGVEGAAAFAAPRQSGEKKQPKESDTVAVFYSPTFPTSEEACRFHLLIVVAVDHRRFSIACRNENGAKITSCETTPQPRFVSLTHRFMDAFYANSRNFSNYTATNFLSRHVAAATSLQSFSTN